MKEIISKENYFYITNTYSVRPIDIFLMEIIDTAINFIAETINDNKKILKIGIDKNIKKKLAEFILKDAYDFIKSCINCKYKCLFEKNENGKKIFEDNFFNKGQIKEEELPEKLKEMKKLDFFIYEMSIGIANKVVKEFKNKYPDDFNEFLYFKIIDNIVNFIKQNCNECNISCLDDPLEKQFICYNCVKGQKIYCPYKENRKEYKKNKIKIY